MIGHVTSSYLSPTLGRSIALAMVAGGRARHGETVYVPMPGRVIAAKVTKPVVLRPRRSASRWLSPPGEARSLAWPLPSVRCPGPSR